MQLEIKPYGALPCSLEQFKINGMKADSDDFGESGDEDPWNAPDYGCGCRRFTANKSQENKDMCMKKYSITEAEFDEICDELEIELYVGGCGWCI